MEAQKEKPNDSHMFSSPYSGVGWLSGAFILYWLLIDHMPYEFSQGTNPSRSTVTSESMPGFKEDSWGSWVLYFVSVLVIKDSFQNLHLF